jgi:hypothetical protein
MNSYLTDIEQFVRRRQPLRHMMKALDRGRITIGFLGGSITEPIEEPWNGKRWSDKVVNWFVGAFPDLIVNVENAAKGATGSQSAIFRVEDDIISRGCDLVFIEYAVNDGGPSDLRSHCREGLIRKLLKDPRANYDIIVVYAYHQPMYEFMMRGEVPPSIAEFEPLCEAYRLSSVFMGDYAFRELNSGRLRYDEWLPDGLHPGDTGSNVYAVPITWLLQDEISRAVAGTKPADSSGSSDSSDSSGSADSSEPVDLLPLVPAPLFPENWEKAYKFPLDDIERHGSWRLVRVCRVPTVDRILYTASVQASLSFHFRGTGFVLFIRFSDYSSDYRYRIDGGEWIIKNDARPDWCVHVQDWIRHDLASSGLPFGGHEVVIEPIFGTNGVCRATNFELCDIGIIS